MNWKDELAALIAQAEKEGKWLWCSYQDLWFSPQQLREANAEGRFLWGPVNWRLRDPKEKLANLKRDARTAATELEKFRSEIAKP